MNKSLENMQNRNNKQAAGNQDQAMASLNKAAGMMQDAMAQMMQQGNGGQGGMMSMMQQLGQMSGQQMSLNQQVQEMMKGNNGKMSQEQMGQMQRLQQQQEVIKKSLDQLNKEKQKLRAKAKVFPQILINFHRRCRKLLLICVPGSTTMILLKSRIKFFQNCLMQQNRLMREILRRKENRLRHKHQEKFPGAFNTDNGKKERNYSDNINKALQGGFTKDYEDLTRKYYNLIK
ncbi:MAG: hypothetical protein IPJ75_12060 [Ignavibacteriales bacterium]|nr:hypothetical protein [Ignavibacteriales bacterium]